MGIEFDFMNGAIGAAGADIPVLCFKSRIPRPAHIVVLEFAVNDDWANMEKLLHVIWLEDPETAVILLEMVSYRGHQHFGSHQTSHDEGGKYYDISILSWRDAIWPLFMRNVSGFQTQDLWSSDMHHPSIRGHALAGHIVAAFLSPLFQQALKVERSHDWVYDEFISPFHPPPFKPIQLDKTLHCGLYDGLVPVYYSDKWKFATHYKGGWAVNTSDSREEIVFAFECPSTSQGCTVKVGYEISWMPRGCVSVRLDDHVASTETLNGWRKGAVYTLQTLQQLGMLVPPGNHTLTFFPVNSTSPLDAITSTGRNYWILQLLAFITPA
eukprot:gb/GEZN01009363.1/.p1 GENE.gb/GEZN01009363.1/~~gb/GEZN01009363.1/.p1  ORF type:complete len:325 (-),score=31.02 gb/GEZN01009363.1/:283-1257(-)